MSHSSEEGRKKCENQPCDTPVREGEEVLQALSRETMVQQVVPQQPMETTLEHVIFREGLQSLGKTHVETGKKCEEERAAGEAVLY